MSEIADQIERLVTPALAAENVELVDVTYQKGPGGWTVALYLDKAGGVTLDDCEKWSRALGDVIDRSDVIDHAYVLEVSSPGLDRPLRKTKDFVRFAGEPVKIRLFGPIEGQRNFHGTLLGGDEDKVRVRLDDGRDMDLPRSQIAKARLDPQIEI